MPNSDDYVKIRGVDASDNKSKMKNTTKSNVSFHKTKRQTFFHDYVLVTGASIVSSDVRILKFTNLFC